ncbi:hypothetical protein [uncultured Psychrobacter sp.]|uniref:hypothetical protein n=1 Tax=uncultured Psychrobacter sp. TaxID=259303 RepID=UPI00260C5F6A|nr:hypothetical protein [uncultured Psychrobacter sp.]
MSPFESKSLFKSIVTTAIALAVSTSALAHSPEMHGEKDQMNCEKIQKHMQMMQNMDHSQMNMDDASMKAMMNNMGKMKQMYQMHCVSDDAKSANKTS